MIRRMVLLLVLASVSGGIAAQQHPNLEKGIGGDAAMQAAGPDSINTFNGNLVINIPIGPRYKVNGELDYGLNLVYNGKPWDARDRSEYNRIEPAASSNAGLGWRVSLGDLIPPSATGNTSGFWIYKGPDGAEHVFYPTLRNGDAQTSGVWYTRDSTYLRLKDCAVVSCPADNSGWTTYSDVEFPDGRVHRFYRNVINATISRIRDAYGNYVHMELAYQDWCALTPESPVCTFTHVLTITDSQGRQHYVRYGAQSGIENMFVRSIDLAAAPAADGSTRRAVHTFNNSLTTVARGCHDSDPETGANASVALLSSVAFPDGSSYTFPAYVAAAQTNCSQGLITRLRLPTLGHLEWEYQTYVFSDPGNEPNRIHRYRVPGVSVRRQLDANGNRYLDGLGNETHKFSYQTQLVSCGTGCIPRELVNTVTTPQGDKSAHYYSVKIAAGSAGTEGWQDADYGLPFTRSAARQTSPNRFLSTEIFNAAGTRIRSTFIRFDREPAYGTTPQNALYDTNRRVVSHRVVYDDDSSKYADTDFCDFDGLGHFRQIYTGGNFDAGNVRTTRTEFNPAVGTYGTTCSGASPGFAMLSTVAPWVLNTFSESSVTEGSSTEKRQFCFEASTGFLLRERTLANSTPASKDLLTVNTRDAQGNMTRVQQYGGEVQPLSTAALCTMTLPSTDQLRINHTYQYGSLKTSQYANSNNVALSFKHVDRDIDFSTGLTLAERDSAGLQTSYRYDLVGRTIRSAPQSGHGGVTEWVYTNATSATATARLEVRNWNNAQTAVLAKAETVYDAFGRVIKERKLMPQADGSSGGSNWSTRELGYNGSGWKIFESEVEAVDPPVNRTVFSNFDSFGRPRTVTAPDGQVTTLGFTGSRVMTRTLNVRTGGTATVLTMTSSTKTEIYDRQGRLFQVREPSRPDGTDATTQYGYDAGGRLISVATTGPEGTQNRYFNYDGRGLLTSEQQPEKGTFGNGTVSYLSYDGSGRLLRKNDGGVDLTYAYDRAGRMTLIYETQTGRVWKELYYASANLTNDWRNGKLQSAVRHNHFDRFAMDITVTENYRYGGRDGRVSQRDTYLSDGTSFSQNFTYNDLGQVSEMQYPYCTGACYDSGIYLTNTYGNGFLTAIPAFALFIRYHPNGMVSEAALGPTTTRKWTQANDPNALPRPSSISTTGFIPSNWSSGTYRYDGAGNIASVGSDYYFYDKVSRLTTGTAENGTMSQVQAYDTFGNLTQLSPRGFSVISTTNRVNAAVNPISYPSYDTRGNMTYFDGQNYEYDAIGMLRALNSNTQDWAFVYTADDERIWSYDLAANVSTWMVRDMDGKVLSTFSKDGDTWFNTTSYVYRGNVLHASYSPQRYPIYEFYAVDHLGSPRRSVDGNGYVFGSHSYFGFGKEATWAGQDGMKFKFTGHERDLCCDGLTLYTDNMHARQYSPIFGRFLQVDPGGTSPGQPQSWNRYAYVANNPLVFVDADGRERIDYRAAYFLNLVYGHDFSNVQVHPARWIAAGSALTIGNHIFFSSRPAKGYTLSEWDNYKLLNNDGLALSVHEAYHILQGRSWGVAVYVLLHALDKAIHLSAGESNWFEKNAYAIQRLAAGFAIANPGIVAKVVQGAPLSDAEKQVIAAWFGIAYASAGGNGSTVTVRYLPTVTQWTTVTSLGGGALGGLYQLFNFEGTLFIDGINMTGVLNYSGGRL